MQFVMNSDVSDMQVRIFWLAKGVVTMKKLFNLEMYNCEKSYWRTFGPFETEKLAEDTGKKVEEIYPMIMCSVSGMNLITAQSDIQDLDGIHRLII